MVKNVEVVLRKGGGMGERQTDDASADNLPHTTLTCLAFSSDFRKVIRP